MKEMLFKPKLAKEDFQESSLPKTRTEVFWDVMNLHFVKFLFYGLIILLFYLPIFFNRLASDAYILGLKSTITEASTAEEINQVTASIAGNKITTALIDVPLIVLFFVGLSGMARIIKRYGFLENVYFKYDFPKGIKQNSPQFILIGMTYAILRLASVYALNLSSFLEGNLFFVLGRVPSVLLSVILGPIGFFMTVCIPVYDNSYTTNLKMSTLLYGRSILKTLGVSALLLIPFFFGFVENFWISTILRLVSTFLIPFLMLIFFLYSFNLLDEQFNKTNVPQLYRKGLIKEEGKEIL